MSGEEQTPATTGGTQPGASERLNIHVKDGDGTSLQFKAKMNMPMKKLMEAYCSNKSADPKSYRFLFDGERIRADDTPASLAMEDEDEIDAIIFQEGGADYLRGPGGLKALI